MEKRMTNPKPGRGVCRRDLIKDLLNLLNWGRF